MRRHPRKSLRGREPEPDELSLWLEVVKHVSPLQRPQAKRKTSKPDSKPKLAVSAPPAPSPPRVPQQPRTLRAPSSGLGTGVDGATGKKLRQGQIEPDAILDLHGMTQMRAHAALDRFMVQSLTSARRCVLIITGVGRGGAANADGEASWSRGPRGILRDLVPLWLESGPHRGRIAKLSRAHIRHGGDGAFYVYLRTKSPSG